MQSHGVYRAIPVPVASQGQSQTTAQQQSYTQPWRHSSTMAPPPRTVGHQRTPSYVPDMRVQGGSPRAPSVGPQPVQNGASQLRVASPQETRLTGSISVSHLGVHDTPQVAARAGREMRKRERSLENVDRSVQSTASHIQSEQEANSRRAPPTQVRSVPHPQPGTAGREPKCSGSIMSPVSVTPVGPSESVFSWGSQQNRASSPPMSSDRCSPPPRPHTLESSDGNQDVPAVRVRRRPSIEFSGNDQADHADRDRMFARPSSALPRHQNDRTRRAESRTGPQLKPSPKKDKPSREINEIDVYEQVNNLEEKIRAEKEALKKNHKDLAARETDLKKLEAELAKREADLAVSGEDANKLAERIKEVEAHEAELNERDRLLAEREEDLKVKELEQTKTLIEKEHALKKEKSEFLDSQEQRRSKHAAKEEQLGERERRLNEREALFQERVCESKKEEMNLEHEKMWLASEKEHLRSAVDKLQKDREDHDRDRERMKRDRDALNRERDQLTQERTYIANQRREIARDAEEESRKLNASITQKRDEVLKREQKIAERESELRTAEANLSQREKDVADRENILNKLEAQRHKDLREREEELQKKASHWWEEEGKQRERQKQLDFREMHHMNAIKEASMNQALFKPTRVSPRNKENREVAKMLEDQRVKNHSIKKEAGPPSAEDDLNCSPLMPKVLGGMQCYSP